MTNDNLDAFTDSGVGGERNFPGAGGADPAITDNEAYALDDTAPVPATSGQTDSDEDFGGEVGITGTDLGGDYGAGSGYPGATTNTDSPARDSSPAGAGEAARHVADSASEQVAGVADTAAEKAAEVRDLALDRGGDVADVARDELTRLAGDAREQLQNLWDQASSQLRDQASAGRQQLAGVLHDLAEELGQMASKSDLDGPVTTFAKQASRRGGELSHWLSHAESSDVLTEIRRFARKRPVAFLAGATVAGVVVGRLSRGLMAGHNTVGSAEANRSAGAPGAPAQRLAAEVPAYGGGASGQTPGYDRAPEGGGRL